MSGSNLPTVDVVIPCYNEEAVIAACLDRLLAQAQDINKIILVDNNSTDKSADVIKKYQHKYPSQIEYLFEKQQGVQFARNLGFNAATADIIARIDADVLVQPGWARAIRQGYQKQPNYMAASGPVDYYDLPLRWLTKAITWVFIFTANALFTHKNTLYGSNMTLRRSAWGEIASDVLMEDGIMEDTAVSLALNRADLHIGHLQQSHASASGRRLRNTPSHFWKYNRMWWQTYKKSGMPGTALGIRVIVWFGNLVHAFGWLILLFHNPNTGQWSLKPRLSSSDQDRILP